MTQQGFFNLRVLFFCFFMPHFAQHLCGFPDSKSEMPHKYWDWAGWNLGHLFVVEYDQRTSDAADRF